MPGQKMMPPLADALVGSQYDRFVALAKTILAVPRSKVMPDKPGLNWRPKNSRWTARSRACAGNWQTENERQKTGFGNRPISGV